MRDNANGADHRKGRGDNPVGDASHHITAAGRDFIHRHGQLHAPVADSQQLRRRQSVGVNQPAGAFQTNHHFIFGLSHGQERCHFLTQRGYRHRAQVAVKVQYEHPAAFNFFALLHPRFLLFLELLERLFGQGRRLERDRHLIVILVQGTDIQPSPAFRLAAAASQQRRDAAHHHQNRSDQRGRLGQKHPVFVQKFHHVFLVWIDDQAIAIPHKTKSYLRPGSSGLPPSRRNPCRTAHTAASTRESRLSLRNRCLT